MMTTIRPVPQAPEGPTQVEWGKRNLKQFEVTMTETIIANNESEALELFRGAVAATADRPGLKVTVKQDANAY